MHSAIHSFGYAIQKVRDLGLLHSAIKSLTTPAIDPSDLLRSQIVLAVSALDHLVHELAIEGMLQVYDGVRPATAAYERFQIPLGALNVGGLPTLSRSSFEASIRERHSYLSFQRPDKIADAIRLFSDVSLWDSVATHLGTNAATIKARINLAVDRRNKIAHEADIDPSYPGARWPIDTSDADGVTTLVDRTGHGIFDACK